MVNRISSERKVKRNLGTSNRRPHIVPMTYFEGSLGDILKPGDVRINLPGTFLGRHFRTSAGHALDVKLECPRDGQKWSLRDLLRANICWLGYSIFQKKINLKRSDKYVAFTKYISINKYNKYISIYYTWQKYNKVIQNRKIKIAAPTWNEKFELSDVSVFCIKYSRLFWIYLKGIWKNDWQSFNKNISNK